MRKRYQKGSLQLQKRGGIWKWLGYWWDGGHRHSKVLGLKSTMSKKEAQEALDKILAPVNGKQEPQTGKMLFGAFVRDVFFPLCRRKWKRSTRITTEQRIRQNLIAEFEDSELRDIGRAQLQDLLDRKADAGLSFSVVKHLQWDLRQIFHVAVAEGFIERNPATLLFTPKNAARPVRRMASLEQLTQVFTAVDVRERVILKLAGITGMRPGEIFGLQWANLEPPYADIRRRVYEGEIDSPKSEKSIRIAALAKSLISDVTEWRGLCLNTAPDAWVFPSETMKTPLRPGNVWRRHVSPKLKAIGLEWINFQVLRRSCSSKLNDEGVDPKVISDQLGHTLDVNLNVYTRVGLERKIEAVNRLDSALRVN